MTRTSCHRSGAFAFLYYTILTTGLLLPPVHGGQRFVTFGCGDEVAAVETACFSKRNEESKAPGLELHDIMDGTYAIHDYHPSTRMIRMQMHWAATTLSATTGCSRLCLTPFSPLPNAQKKNLQVKNACKKIHICRNPIYTMRMHALGRT